MNATVRQDIAYTLVSEDTLCIVSDKDLNMLDGLFTFIMLGGPLKIPQPTDLAL
jgi:hypothetical protein